MNECYYILITLQFDTINTLTKVFDTSFNFLKFQKKLKFDIIDLKY